MSIKWRPSILLIATGLIAGLIISLLAGYGEIANAIVVALAASISKLVESEEKSP